MDAHFFGYTLTACLQIRAWLRSSVDSEVNITMFRRDKQRREFVYVMLEKVSMATVIKKKLEYVK